MPTHRTDREYLPIMLAAGIAVYRAYLEAGGTTPAVVAGQPR